MKQQTKITLKELVARKEAMLESKRQNRTAELYIRSLDGTITVACPTAALAREAQGMDNGDVFLAYQCIVEPPVKSKELQEAFECVEPMDIIDKLFLPGEIPQISMECLKLAGYIDGVHTMVGDLKN